MMFLKQMCCNPKIAMFEITRTIIGMKKRISLLMINEDWNASPTLSTFSAD